MSFAGMHYVGVRRSSHGTQVVTDEGERIEGIVYADNGPVYGQLLVMNRAVPVPVICAWCGGQRAADISSCRGCGAPRA